MLNLKFVDANISMPQDKEKFDLLGIEIPVNFKVYMP